MASFPGSRPSGCSAGSRAWFFSGEAIQSWPRRIGQAALARRNAPSASVHVGDALAYLRTRRAAFRAIFCTDLLEHVPHAELLEWVRALREALVPDGSSITTVARISIT